MVCISDCGSLGLGSTPNRPSTYRFINTLFPFSLTYNEINKGMINKATYINPALTDPLSTGAATSSILNRLKVRQCGDCPLSI
jgi:hypothetical protein